MDYESILDYNVSRNSIAINPLDNLNYTGNNIFTNNVLIEINETNKTVINNFGKVESKPTITLWGTGDIKLTINENVILLNNIQGKMTIDSEMMECYSGTLPCNNKMFGEFPILKLGKNEIIWEGNLERLKIKHNTCYL